MDFSLRPSTGLLQSISSIERASGNWDRLSRNNAVINSNTLSLAMEQTIRHALLLEGVVIEDKQLQRLGRIYRQRPFDNIRDLFHLYRLLMDLPNEKDVGLRTKPLELQIPSARRELPAVLFKTVSPFLIEKRLEDLLEWTERELSLGSIHPLCTIGIFHLCFLQIAPFPARNHALVLAVTYHLLRSNSYSFVEYAPLSEQFSTSRDRYYLALRQSEKTAGGDWSTLNAWLDYFLDCVRNCVRSVISREDSELEKKRLSSVQRMIVEVVKTHGPVSREQIAERTNINISTIKYNLGVLARRGILRREGGGRATSYLIN